MDLWIRSQDRMQLRKVESLAVFDNKLIGEVAMCYSIINGGRSLGEYKTKERALEVLDEIQNFIKKECKKFVQTGDYYTCRYEYDVYEIPKE